MPPCVPNPRRRAPLRSRRLRRRDPPRLPRARPRLRRESLDRRVLARRSTSTRPTTRSRSSMDLPASTRGRARRRQGRRASSSPARKPPRRGRGESSFHLVERGYGRFARVVRLTRAVRHAPARARRSPTASCASSLPKIADRRGRDRDSDRRSHDRTSSRADAIRILFIGDIVGRPGRELVRRGLRGARRPPSDRSRHRQRRERRRRLRHHARDRRPAARLGRRRDDLRQSHLGQEGSARLHRRRAAAAAAGQLPGRRRRATAAISRGRATAGRSASSTSWAACSC